jgi:hypothetical protein
MKMANERAVLLLLLLLLFPSSFSSMYTFILAAAAAARGKMLRVNLLLNFLCFTATLRVLFRLETFSKCD